MAVSIAVPQQNPLEDLLANLPKANAVEYRRGQLIYNAAQSSDRVYLVTDGKVMVSRIVNAEKQVVVDVCQPPELFGESALVNCFSRGEQALALENCKVMSWPAADILDRVTRQSHLGIVFLQVLAQREAELTWRMESLAVDTIHVRVARSLIRLSGRIGTRQEDGSAKMAPLTHKMLSQYIGSTREIVTHHMTEFRKLGYLNYSRNGIVIYRDALIEWLQRNSHGRFTAWS
jgi:CRP-like cAMP-binding protein